jgi:hypothetical protein
MIFIMADGTRRPQRQSSVAWSLGHSGTWNLLNTLKFLNDKLKYEEIEFEEKKKTPSVSAAIPRDQ